MRRIASLWTLAVFGVGACATVLDIEELESGVAPDKAGGGQSQSGGRQSGAAGEGGSEPSGGKSSAGGAQATGGGGASGAPSSGGTSGNSSEVGGEGGASTPAGGESSEGGAPASTGAVEGRVIDFWGHPVPNVPVGIGDQTDVTDRDGKFSIADVTTPYEVSLRIETERVNYVKASLAATRRCR
jgi:hypothetical protein